MDREPGTSCILNRQAFIDQLGEEANKLDVNIYLNDKIKSFGELSCDYIIDASGCPSTIKRELGFSRGYTGVTFQHTIENCNVFNSKNVKIFYSKKFGYFWIFPRDPQKKEVNVGVGFIQDFGYDLKKTLEEFKQQHGIVGTVSYVSGGLIPMGLQPPLKYKNILFVGDAGVGTFPFSGQGIYRALLSGHTAGRLIAGGKENTYPYIIKKMFIKWDIIGKSFILINLWLRKINEQFVLYSLNKFISVDKLLHI
jgi:flavin-dependent dehydrogenase